jgi:hypothetical protein
MGGALQADEPLHQRIDALIEVAAEGLPKAEPADDAEFFRRVNLDFAGVIPTIDEVRVFLHDVSPDKRQRAIENLLAGPRYAQRMREVFHVHLMERRGENDLWQVWLEKSFAENKPWDQMAREIIRADFRVEENRGAAYFYTRRLEKSGQNPTDYPGLTRDVGRLFLGMDLQCAECHNHRLIDDYNQVDFQGLLAAFSNLTLLREEYPAVEEKLMQAKLEYASVFTGKPRAVAPRVPGLDEVEIPVFAKGEEYLQIPDRKTKTPGVPKFSPLENFAEQIPQSPTFSANIVNRLWFLMMGRGLVHPLDQLHSDNPPSHPAVLDLLAREFVAHEYDIRWLLRELALTEIYQLSSRLPEGVASLPAEKFRVGVQRRLSAEQLLWSTLRATGNSPDEVPLETVEAEEDDNEDFVGLRERFQQALANDSKDPEHDFAPSLKGALFMMNDEEVLKLLDAGEGSIVPRLAAQPSNEEVTEQLFLQIFSRLPDAAEQKETVDFLAGADRRQAIKDLAWGMLTSTEFVVNH